MAFIEKVRTLRTDTVMRNVNKIFTAVFVSLMDLQYKLRLISMFSHSPSSARTVNTLSLDPSFNSTTLYIVFSYSFVVHSLLPLPMPV